jgi:hypothetical protein
MNVVAEASSDVPFAPIAFLNSENSSHLISQSKAFVESKGESTQTFLEEDEDEGDNGAILVSR